MQKSRGAAGTWSHFWSTPPLEAAHGFRVLLAPCLSLAHAGLRSWIWGSLYLVIHCKDKKLIKIFFFFKWAFGFPGRGHEDALQDPCTKQPPAGAVRGWQSPLLFPPFPPGCPERGSELGKRPNAAPQTTKTPKPAHLHPPPAPFCCSRRPLQAPRPFLSHFVALVSPVPHSSR